MSSKNLIKLAAALGVLLVLALAAKFMSKSAPAAKLTDVPLADRAGRIEITGPSGRFTFARSSTSWTMEKPISYAVDNLTLKALLDKASDVTLSDELTVDNARYPLFGLSESSATRVKISDVGGKALLDFYAGKDGADYETFYLRPADRPGVQQAQGMSGREWTKPLAAWLDKSIVSLANNDVTHLGFKGEKGKISLDKVNGVWTSAKVIVSTAAVDGPIKAALDSVARLDADKIVPAAEAPDPAKTGLANPDFRLELAAGDKRTVLKVGKAAEPGQRWAKKEGEERVLYQISERKLDPLRAKEFAALGKK